MFDPEAEANHGSLHVKTLDDGLRTLYADWATLPETVALGGAAAIRAHRKGLADRFGYDIGLGRAALLRLRMKWIAEKNFDALVALARFGWEERPAAFDHFLEHFLLDTRARKWIVGPVAGAAPLTAWLRRRADARRRLV